MLPIHPRLQLEAARKREAAVEANKTTVSEHSSENSSSFVSDTGPEIT